MAEKHSSLGFKDIIESVVIAIILALIIRTFLFQFFGSHPVLWSLPY